MPSAPLLVRLTNKTRGLLVLSLPADVLPQFSHVMAIGVRDHDPVTGARVLRAVKKHVGSSLTLCAAGTEGCELVVPCEVKRAPQVRAAIASGAVAAEDVVDLPPSPPDPPPPAPGDRGGKSKAKE